MDNYRQDLLILLKRQSLKKGDFILTSGKKTGFYIDARATTLTPKGAYLAASLVLDYAKSEKINAIGGPTMGADPIIGAIASLCYLNKLPIITFIIRGDKRKHGTKKQIEGPIIKKGSKILLIDDVATTGKSLIKSKKILNSSGYQVNKALVLMDRNEGAKENLAKNNLGLNSIFSIEELI